MTQNRPQYLIGVLACILTFFPLLVLQFLPRRTTIEANVTETTISDEFGWPFRCTVRHRTEATGTGAIIHSYRVTQTPRLIANILSVAFVGVAYWAFFSGVSLQRNVTILEMMAVVFVIAVFCSPWFADAASRTTANEVWYPRWAEYIMFFAGGAAVAAMLRFFIDRPTTAKTRMTESTNAHTITPSD